MKFRDQLHLILTARDGVIDFKEFFSIVGELLNETYKREGATFISPRLIVTRWISDGFIEANIEKGGFQIRRPTLLSLRNGKWVLVGARYSPVIDHLENNLTAEQQSTDEYSTPKVIYKQKLGRNLDVGLLVSMGCDVIGDSESAAADVILEQSGSLDIRLRTGIKDYEQYMSALRWFNLNTNDFSLSPVDFTLVSPGHYMLRKYGLSGKPITKFIKLLSNKKIIEFEDWRWLYVSAMADSNSPSECFYEPKKKTFCVNNIISPFDRNLVNWLPKEIALTLGACSASNSITTAVIQDFDGKQKTIISYPNIKLPLALKVYDALGLNRVHPLRYLQYTK
jgi:hypothetical protein